jgi:hypothetical protein
MFANTEVVQSKTGVERGQISKMNNFSLYLVSNCIQMEIFERNLALRTCAALTFENP